MPNVAAHNKKASAEWYTPDWLWDLVCSVYQCNRSDIFDPCPIGGSMGLQLDWSLYQYPYINPPTPARLWAEKAIGEVGTSLYMAFSESVIWQCPKLLEYPGLFFRKRIKWESPNEKIINRPSNYNALFLVHGSTEQFYRLVDFGSQYGSIHYKGVIYKK